MHPQEEWEEKEGLLRKECRDQSQALLEEVQELLLDNKALAREKELLVKEKEASKAMLVEVSRQNTSLKRKLEEVEGAMEQQREAWVARVKEVQEEKQVSPPLLLHRRRRWTGGRCSGPRGWTPSGSGPARSRWALAITLGLPWACPGPALGLPWHYSWLILGLPWACSELTLG